jgi:ABC-type cobalamin/Fe3+-siderophores transport system ATPase subunit
MPIVTAEALSLGYGRRQVFDEVSFEFGEGVTALLGPNGAGKTTLLNAAASPAVGRLPYRARRSKEHDVPSAARRPISRNGSIARFPS